MRSRPLSPLCRSPAAKVGAARCRRACRPCRDHPSRNCRAETGNRVGRLCDSLGRPAARFQNQKSWSAPSRRTWPEVTSAVCSASTRRSRSSIARSPNRPWRRHAALRPRHASRHFRASLRAQILALHAIVGERRQAADGYRASMAASADQLERIAQISYDAGERSILELLDAYRSSGSARTRQVQLDAAARQAEIELERVSGWEIR